MKLFQWSDQLIQCTWTELTPYFTHVLVYQGHECTFVVDTFLGPGKMREMLASLPGNYQNRPFIVVNTHYHFDHIWGNQAFSESLRVATPLCRKWIEQRFEEEKQTNLTWWEEGNQICLPNCLITAPLFFPEDQIEIFPSPGHTEDGCSVMFHQENILSVGDNLEQPIPYLENKQWDHYLRTLDRYDSLQPKIIIPGHGQAGFADIEITRLYILGWKSQDLSRYDQEPYREVHRQNTQILI